MKIRAWIIALLATVGISVGATFAIAAITANPAPVCSAGTCTVTFAAGNEYSFNPAAGTPLTVTLKGGAGGTGGNDSQAGSVGQKGDTVSFTIAAPATPISIYPGGAGANGASAACGTGGGAGGVSAGGFSGGRGGNAGPACSSGAGGGGGAASVITVSGVNYIAAGGGGGAGGDQFCSGPASLPYSAAQSTANTFGAAGANGTGDGSGAGGGGAGLRSGNGGGMGACGGESLGYGGYSGLSSAPAGATTTVASNAGAGSVVITYPDKITTVITPAKTFVTGTSVTYTVTFAESVTGLTTSDFRITGTATNCAVTALTGSGTTYSVTVSGCDAPLGDKTLILTLPVDSATNASSRGNGAAVAATVTLDDAAPTVALSGPTPISQKSSFDVTLTGNEALDNVAVSDFTVSGAGCSISGISGSGATRTITITGCQNATTAKLTLTAGSVTDLAGNTAPTKSLEFSTLLDIPAAPNVKTDATISGTTSNGLVVGDVLTIGSATFGPADHDNVVYNTYKYVWYRCYSAQSTASSAVAADCEVIPDASAKSYTLTQNEIGYFIRGAVVATNATGTIFTASANSPVVREYDILSSGWNNTCVVKEGLVYCWGLNNYGQAGNGTTVNVLTPPTQPLKLANGSNLTNVVSVDAGSEHACALTAQGAMYCWGRNNWYQLGDGTNVNKLIATPVTATATGGIGFGSGVVSISVGEAHTCAVKVGGAAFCWGYNDYGQLSDGTTVQKTVPTRVLAAAGTPATNITDAEINRYDVCVLSNAGGVTGQVLCAGHGGNGQMGNNTTTTYNTYLTKVFSSVADNTFTDATDISLGSHQICAVKSDAAYCWGYQPNGQHGYASTANTLLPRTPNNTAAGISFASGVIQVEVSKDATGTSCFLKSSGAVYCAGLGTSGQLADGTTVSKTTAVASTFYSSATTTLTLGEAFICAIDATGLSCVGANTNGQLGNGTTTNSPTAEVKLTQFDAHLGAVDEKPVPDVTTISGYAGTGQLMSGSTVVEAATNSWYGYPLPALTYQWVRCDTASGVVDPASDCVSISGATNPASYIPGSADVGKYLRLLTIGSNLAGTSYSYSATSAAVGIGPANTALPTIALKAGSAGTIPGNSAVITPGTWTGSPTPTSSYKWMRCATNSAVSTLTLPTDCVYITDATGLNYTFTQSDVGSFIRGVEISSSSSGVSYAYTATVGVVKESRTLAAGLNHTCVIKLGYVYCWGDNTDGQLGDGTTVDKTSMPTVPVKLADGSYLKNVVSVDAGFNQTCAVTTAGAMYCWGNNANGQLGDGTVVSKSVATPVSGLSSGVVGLASGYYATCAIKTGGALVCWGYNGNGQIGDNTNTQRLVPTQVQGFTSGVTQVTTGYQTTCAIRGGALYCWGYNGNGQIGDGTTSARWLPTAVSGMSSNVTDVSEGWTSTCAVEDGAAYCWGNNADGQLGDNTVTSRTTPVLVASTSATPAISFASGVIDVENSEYSPGYACFTKQSQKIYCTGNNAQGQLGTGNATAARLPVAPALLSGSITASALGAYHTCVIMDLKVSCIGYNLNGEIANGTTTSTSTVLSTQTAFGNPTGALDVAPIAAASSYTGFTGLGQTVTGATVIDAITGTWVGYSYPVLTYQWLRCSDAGLSASTVPANCEIIDGATAKTYVIGASDIGSYLRFQTIGTNSVGLATSISATGAKVGLAPANTDLPFLVDNNGGYAGSIPGVVETIDSGSWSGNPSPSITYQWYRCLSPIANPSDAAPSAGDCALIDSAAAKTYTLTQSDVGYYVVGIETASSTSGVDQAFTQSTTLVKESHTIAAGDSHVCAIRLGRIYCWGDNSYGQLGDGTTVSKSTAVGPLKLSDGTILENVVSVDAQDTATCAVTVAGLMYCWGVETNGEFGDGTAVSTTRSYPTLVLAAANTPLTGVVGMATGSAHTCAIRTGGELWCFGYNGYGQLGDATTTNRGYPVKVIASGVQQVSADYYQTCAIVSGAAKCWGLNNYNQLGDGTSTSRSVPTAVTGLTSGVTDISVGFIHSCAIKNGAAFCWGYNAYGQLGDGTTAQKAVPTQVAPSAAGVVFTSDVVNIDASENNPEHTCLTKTGGVLYCFGVGSNSALANGLTANATVPSPSTLWPNGVSEVTTGYQFTCVVRNGADYCTGYNNAGQVGNGTTTTSAASNAISQLANYAGALDVLPVPGTAAVTGIPAVGQTLTGSATGWVGFPMPTVTYQWYNCTKAGGELAAVPADCQLITGETNPTYVPVAADENNYIRLAATVTNAAGVVTVVTPAQLIGTLPDATFIKSTSAPSGFIPVGTVITQYADTWTANPAATTANAWYRCATPGTATEVVPNDCVLIAGANASTYTTTQSDVGQYIRGAQVATNTLGSTVALAPTAGYVTEAQTVAVGSGATCVVKAGEVWCAGVNTNGELGNNTTVTSSVPVKVLIDATTPLTKVVSIDGGGPHFCAITESGTAYCWGDNVYGQIGSGTTVDSKIAVPVSGGAVYAAISAGSYNTCAIKVGGALQCWGNAANYLTVGDGTSVNKSVPTQVATLTSGVSKVSVGYISVCAIKTGALYCWGTNSNYQFGNGNTTASSSPVAVASMTTGVTDVSVSTANACAVKNGAALCWGYNADGQLGTGNTTQVSTPTQVVATASGVTFTSGVTDVEVSNNTNNRDWACFNKSGALYCTGFGTSGTLFDGGSVSSNKPVVATNFATGVSEVSLGWGTAGYGAGCLVKDGALYCVGTNESGQLMNSTTSPIGTPIRTALAPAAFATNLGDVKSAPVVVVPPSVIGTPGLNTVTPGSPGSYSANPAATLNYQWYSCTLTGGVASAAPADCVLATGTGANSTDYVPNSPDDGRYLRLAVTATNSAGSVTSVSATSAMVVLKGDQFITMTQVAAPFIGGSPVELAAVDSANLPVTYTSSTPLICSVADGKVTALTSGRCVIAGANPGNETYKAASATLELFIEKSPNAITFSVADQVYSNDTFELTGTATSKLAVSYASSTPAICTVSGTTVTKVNVGTCVITATQAGDANIVAATPVVATFAIAKADQMVATAQIRSVSIYDTTGVALNATATSGGQVILKSLTPTICDFVAGKLVGKAVGTCEVLATQAGNTKYNPAQVTVQLAVTRAPAITSVTTTVTSPTNLAEIPVTITWDSDVTGFTATDITTAPSSCEVKSLSGSGSQYVVTLANCSDGEVKLSIAKDAVAAAATGPETTFTSPALFTVDRTAPSVQSITSVTASPTKSTSLDFTVTFSEPVTGFTVADLSDSGTAANCSFAISAVSATVYSVTATGCTDGTVALTVAKDSVSDAAANNGPNPAFTATPAITVDQTAATVASITTDAVSPTNVNPVVFTVTFSEGVTGFTADDLTLDGTSIGCVSNVVAVSTSVYKVELSDCTDGTAGIVVNASRVADLAGNSSPAEAKASPLVTIDKTAPSVVLSRVSDANVNTLPISFKAVFSEAVTGVTASDFELNGTATGCSLAVTKVNATDYNISVTGCSDGTVGISLKKESVLDVATNPGPLESVASELSKLDRVAPTTVSVVTNEKAFTNADPINYTVTFGEAVKNVDPADFKVIGTATGCDVVVTEFSASVYTVGVTGCDTDGTVALQVLAGSVTDLAGNVGPAISTTGNSVTLDRIAPDAPVVDGVPGEFTTATTVDATFPTDSRYTYQCEFDGSPITCVNGTVKLGSLVNPLAEGEHELKVWVTDQAGNQSVAADYVWTIGNYQTPLAPEAPVATRPTLTTMSVKWNKPEASAEIPIQGYELSYTTDSITWLKATTTEGEDATEYTLPGVTSGVVYKFRVKALAAVPADNSPWSAEGPYVAVYLPNVTELSVTQSLLTPPTGATTVITGEDFEAGETVVKFGDTPAVVKSVNAEGTQAVVTIPPATQAGTVDISVTVGTGQFTGASRKVKAFTYLASLQTPSLTHTPPTGIRVGAAGAVSASVTSGTTPTFAIASDSINVCKVENGKIVGLAAGTCNYTVSAPGAPAYSALVATPFSTTIAKGANTTTFNLPDAIVGGSTPISDAGLPLAATSSAGIPVSYSSTTPTICYVDASGVLRMIKVGSCSVTASSGDANFDSSMVTKTFNVVKAAQTLSFVAPGAEIPLSIPTAKAPIASNDPNGFKLVASVNSGLPLTYTSLNPTVCEVDSDGVVSWLADLKKYPKDTKYNTCKVKITQAGDANYSAMAPYTATLVAVPVKAPVPPGGVITEPELTKSLPRASSKAVFGSDGFDIKMTPTSVTVSPYSKGIWTGVITATVNVNYKVAGIDKVQKCVVKFGITKKMTKAQGAFKMKTFTTKLTCTLNKDAFAYYKAGNQMKINAVVIRDRRWPTTYLKVFGTEAGASRKGEKIYPTKRIFNLNIG